MKKVISTMVLMAMCISLVGCGNEASKSDVAYEKYKELVNAIENGNEALAKEEFEKFFPNSSFGDVNDNNNPNNNNSQSGGSGVQTDSEKESESEVIDPAVVVFQKIAACEWQPDIWSKENKGAQAFTLYSDGSCDVFGENLQWVVDYASEQSYGIEIYREENIAYDMSITKDKDYGFYNAYVSRYSQDDGSREGIADRYYATSNLSKIEITIDNWQEYFELIEITNMDYDAFQEPYRYYVNNYLRLKAACGSAVAAISDVAVEYSYYNSSKKVYLNYETKGYTIEDVNTNGEKEFSTRVSEMMNWYMGDEQRYGVEVVDFYLDCKPEQVTSSWEIFESVSRILGYVYVVKE